jgi:hypothetical protein
MIVPLFHPYVIWVNLPPLIIRGGWDVYRKKEGKALLKWKDTISTYNKIRASYREGTSQNA